jgi:hypothetical protein
MKARKWFLGVATAGVAVVVGVAHADQLDQQIKGKLTAVDVTSGARGEFRMDTVARTNGNGREVVVMNARRLGATPDAGGQLPSYHVVLIDAAATTTTDFGAVRLNRAGQAYFRFDSRFDDYPAGVTTITAYGGGTFELQHEGTAVLRGDIHSFVGLTQEASKDARAHFHGNSRMHATINGGAGRGKIDADMHNEPNHVTQRLRVDIQMVGKLGSPFSIVALDVGGAEVVLGTITTHGRSGQGSLMFHSRRGDVIPGGGIPALLGKTIEVRNSQGTAVVTGVFPSIP